MNPFNPNWLFLFLGLAAIFLELMVGVASGFDLVLLGIALILGGLIGNWIGSWEKGLGAAILFSLLYIFLGRKFVQEKLGLTTHQTNIDQLLGKEGIVLKEITPKTAGQVKVGTEIWRAESKETLGKGERVKVISLEGVTLRVIKLS